MSSPVGASWGDFKRSYPNAQVTSYTTSDGRCTHVAYGDSFVFDGGVSVKLGSAPDDWPPSIEMSRTSHVYPFALIDGELSEFPDDCIVWDACFGRFRYPRSTVGGDS